MAGLFGGGSSGPSAADLKAQEEAENRQSLAAVRNEARRANARIGVGSLLSTGLQIPGTNQTQ